MDSSCWGYPRVLTLSIDPTLSWLDWHQRILERLPLFTILAAHGSYWSNSQWLCDNLVHIRGPTERNRAVVADVGPPSCQRVGWTSWKRSRAIGSEPRGCHTGAKKGLFLYKVRYCKPPERSLRAQAFMIMSGPYVVFETTASDLACTKQRYPSCSGDVVYPCRT